MSFKALSKAQVFTTRASFDRRRIRRRLSNFHAHDPPQHPGAALDRSLVHRQDARHSEKSAPTFGMHQLEFLIRGALTLDPLRLVVTLHPLAILAIKSGSPLIYESHLGVDQLHDRPLLCKKIVEEINGLGFERMMPDGIFAHQFIKTINPQPLGTEALCQTPGLRRSEHPADLFIENFLLTE